MADAIQNVKQDYWRPATGVRRMNPVVSDATCECGAEYLLGARYCHICGADRVPDMGLRPHGFDFVQWLDFGLIRQRTGFGTASLVLFLLGICCSAAGIAVGFLYTVNSQLDWQAVQMWRVEWLLGAAVAFLAAIALKKAPSGNE